jgi:hypothetical protein
MFSANTGTGTAAAIRDTADNSAADTSAIKQQVPENGIEVVMLCQRQAVQRGEVAVPVSAQAESWELLKQAAGIYTESHASSDNSHVDDNNAVEDTVVEKAVDVEENGTDVDAETVANMKNKSGRPMLPPVGSPQWEANEEALRRVRADWGGTGVLEAVSAAVRLRPPVYCYPVSDLDSEAPVGWTAGKGIGTGINPGMGSGWTPSSASTTNSASSSTSGAVDSSSSSSSQCPRLRDCILLKPGSTVGDVFDALKRGALAHVLLQGDFVRAEGRGLDPASRKRQLGREAVVGEACCVLRIQTNRKALWQQQYTEEVSGKKPAS